MKIKLDTGGRTARGRFGRMDPEKSLRVAPSVFAVARTLGATTAESFYDVATGDPQVVAEMLDWAEDEVRRASEDLRTQIAAAIPGYFDRRLKPASAFRRGVPARGEGSREEG